MYNNAAIPAYCDNEDCGYYFGGKFVLPAQDIDARMLTDKLASIRDNTAGVNTRIFVEIGEKKKVSKYVTVF